MTKEANTMTDKEHNSPSEKTLKDLCTEYGLGQSALARRFDIPLRTVQNWYAGVRIPPAYVIRMIDEILRNDEQAKASGAQQVTSK